DRARGGGRLRQSATAAQHAQRAFAAGARAHRQRCTDASVVDCGGRADARRFAVARSGAGAPAAPGRSPRPRHRRRGAAADRGRRAAGDAIAAVISKLASRLAALDAALRPIANRPVDITQPGWAERRMAPLDEAGVRTASEALLADLLTLYRNGRDEQRGQLRPR